MAVAPNGGRKTKADHPALPLTADELARAAAECLERGASMIHLHVRDAEGRHCLDAEAYRAAIARICEAGRRSAGRADHQRIARALFPRRAEGGGAQDQSRGGVAGVARTRPREGGRAGFGEFLGQLKQMRIWPQIILYSPDEAARLGAMVKQGLIPFDSLSVLYVLGRFALMRTAAPRDLLPFLAPDMPRFESWSVCAFGRREAACVTAAALLGGHARVGFENNLFLPDGARAASNAELVGPRPARSKRSGLRPKARTA